MAHKQVALDLLKGIQYHANHNQKAGTTEELREAHADTKEASKSRQDSDDSQEDGTGKRDTGHNRIDILSRLLTGFYTGDKTIIQFQIFCHLNRINDNSSLEIGESDDEDSEDEVIPKSVVIAESAYKRTASVGAEAS